MNYELVHILSPQLADMIDRESNSKTISARQSLLTSTSSMMIWGLGAESATGPCGSDAPAESTASHAVANMADGDLNAIIFNTSTSRGQL